MCASPHTLYQHVLRRNTCASEALCARMLGAGLLSRAFEHSPLLLISYVKTYFLQDLPNP